LVLLSIFDSTIHFYTYLGCTLFKAFWLYSDNLELDGQPPANLLSSDPAKVIEAAAKVNHPLAYFGW